MQDWTEVLIETDLDAGELLAALDDPGATGGWQEPGIVRLYWPATHWRPETRRRLERLLRALGVSPHAMAVRTFPGEDWNAAWARSVQPLRLGRRLLIRPSWTTGPGDGESPGLIDLRLDPKQAFGTGHHATTRLLLEWLEDLYETGQGGRRVLDIGTGSGILVLAALRLGASSAVAIDCDPVAIACAREAAELNGVGPELDLRVASLEHLDLPPPRPDLVLANLDRRTILGAAPKLAEVTGRSGRLLCSGVLVEDRADLAATFLATGLALRRVRESDGWVALELVAALGCED